MITRRLAGCVDVASGAVIVRQRDRFNVKEMYRFFYFVEKQYPDADVIYIALDKWPVHFHGYVSDHLAARHSRIRLLPLPTSAPWTNPMEKVWLKLVREILTQHPKLKGLISISSLFRHSALRQDDNTSCCPFFFIFTCF